MSRPGEVPRDLITAVRQQVSGLTGQSARTLLLGTVLWTSVVSLVTGIIYVQYFSIDVFSSLLYVPQDCWLDWDMNIGRHCFSDYAWQATAALRPDPWEHLGPPNWPGNPYPPAAMVPFLIFGLLGKWLHWPQLGLFCYLMALVIAVLSPALWATRGARGLERLVTFLALGVAAIPAWVAVDRGNSTGFLAPIALVFLVALCRQRWGLVAVMVILAALLKPQLVVLAVALFAARQWRMGGIAVVGAIVANLSAYLLWPSNFPGTITQSIHNALGYGAFSDAISVGNVSFGKALLWIPDGLKVLETGGTLPDGYLAGLRGLIGYGVLALVVGAVLILGRRVPPVVVGIVLLAAASLFPAVTYRYYLVFVLAVAALIVRDPDGPTGAGLFDRIGEGRRVVAISVSLAAALSLAHVAVPGPSFPVPVAGEPGVLTVFGTSPVITTTAVLAPALWLIASAVIILSYMRKPARDVSKEASSSSVSDEPAPIASP
ncbi:glycosyltransferase family 87 protein [Mycobacterium marinum]|uniref:glycosyltransferase family 87 protein n=1 Tax=Mycobacterium marinum TaxID=1781 RepID=UPI0035642E00